MDRKITVQFADVQPAEANKLAQDLKDYLLRNTGEKPEIIKERTDTQDFGATLAIILGTTSVVAIAKGLSNWLVKHQSRKLTIFEDGKIIGENLSSADIKAILEHKK